ncbi:peamaclein [Brachypodium distachyon]|uniref:Uncharacterized protein n=1 Tax=Brachypodium distachyon TaxID=15368 RepID=I1IFN2_BRADI|nr:peamaclein [Brachypodium distachyon]KQK02100.1 hypothetical protein BRADI_3g60370v3 [Brachypodium distachyon]|eukprot:XP_003570717.1 peamaclein [Brachypodium distachyon]
MAFSGKPVIAVVLLSLALLVLVDAQQATTDDSSVLGGSQRSLLQAPKIDCGSACEARCGRNWKNKMCNKMCNICCGKCSCVPSGTGQDTRNQCPCYANMLNSKNGKPKCP